MSHIKRELLLAVLTVLISTAAIHASYILYGSSLVDIPDQESVGIIVNVQRQGKIHPTWDLWLLHGNNNLAEGESERFSFPSEYNPKLLAQAYRYQEEGQRVKLLYSSLSFRDCYIKSFAQVNDCDIVEEIKPLN